MKSGLQKVWYSKGQYSDPHCIHIPLHLEFFVPKYSHGRAYTAMQIRIVLPETSIFLLMLRHQVAFILLFTSQFTVQLIIFAYWTQLLEHRTHGTIYFILVQLASATNGQPRVFITTCWSRQNGFNLVQPRFEPGTPTTIRT